jgi:hypothetical protein
MQIYHLKFVPILRDISRKAVGEDQLYKPRRHCAGRDQIIEENVSDFMAQAFQLAP